MNLVSGAMRRPITVVVLITAVVLGAILAVDQMPRDIFPNLGTPTIYVSQPYGGMDPAQMEGFLTNYYEYHFLYITGIEHVESKNIQGVALIKLRFHPGTDMAQAMAETTAFVDRSRAFMPPGTLPPFILRLDAGSVPVGNLVFSSETRSVSQLQDLALFRVRPLFATLPGVSAPPPYGGSQRTIVVRIDPDRLQAYNLSLEDVVAKVASANQITPAGNAVIGGLWPMVPTNSVVRDIRELEKVPLKLGVFPTVFLRDIGVVEDASDIITCHALVNGRRTVYIPVTKRADASTLAVVNLVKANLSKLQAVLPEDVKVSYEFDQSPYVKRSINGLIMESAMGAILTGLMVLLFLRDWRSAVVVVLNIPFSLAFAAFALWLTGDTVNIMTLGGLALAVGMLVDEATVTIENIHTHLSRGKSIPRSSLDATSETVLPRFVSMLCVLSVFVPSFFMKGAARALFVPLSMAVGFSMVASYVLSSTLVPVLSTWILRTHHAAAEKPSRFSFARFQAAYARLLEKIVRRRRTALIAYLLGAAGLTLLVGSRLGTEIFPQIDTGQFQLRLRAPTGTYIDPMEQITLKTLDVIRNEVGPQNVDISLAFVGVHPTSYSINTIYLWSGGPHEAVLNVQLKPGSGIRIAELQETLRRKLPEVLPKVTFSFEPGDIVSRVMSFGSPTPVEVAAAGPDLDKSRAYAERLRERLAQIPLLRDLQYGQTFDYPTVRVDVDRERSGIMGITVADVSRAAVAATSSSRFVVPLFWADPRSGVGYQVQVEIPQTRITNAEQVRNLSMSPTLGTLAQQILLRNVAEVTEGTTIGEYDRYNMQRLVTLTANMIGDDLGRVARHVDRAVKDVGEPPRGVTVSVRGQIAPMQQMFHGLEAGLLLTVVVIFLLLASNFESLRISLATVSTVPAVVAGVAVALWISRTTINVESFMGATMGIGIAVANAILLVTFAERARMAGAAADAAANEGARSRLRPILMTSLAMIAGMVPMALALGEGGEQTAPLGRAVIGGLAAATLASLLVLPCVFAMIQDRTTRQSASLDPDDPASPYAEPATK